MLFLIEASELRWLRFLFQKFPLEGNLDDDQRQAGVSASGEHLGVLRDEKEQVTEVRRNWV